MARSLNRSKFPSSQRPTRVRDGASALGLAHAALADAASVHDEVDAAMKQPAKPTIGRRDFLRVFGIGVVAASAPAGKAKADTESGDERRKPRYKETDHIKTYYRVNRYPS